MKYRNRKTGNVIDVPCFVDGPDWERFDDPPSGAGQPENRGKTPKGAENPPENTNQAPEDGTKRPKSRAKRPKSGEET